MAGGRRSQQHNKKPQTYGQKTIIQNSSQPDARTQTHKPTGVLNSTLQGRRDKLSWVVEHTEREKERGERDRERERERKRERERAREKERKKARERELQRLP